MLDIWIVKDCELLPLPDSKNRLMRAGLTAQALIRNGHKVRWFTSGFNHFTKEKQTTKLGHYQVDDRLILDIAPSKPYKKNISFKRLYHNHSVAQHFAKRFRELPSPDLIICDFPTPDCAHVVSRFCLQHNVRFIMCVRDLWPDFFTQHLQFPLKQLALPLLAYMNFQTKSAFKASTGVVGISKGYLDFGLQKANREQSNQDGVFPLGYPKASTTDQELRTAQKVLTEKGVDLTKPIAVFVGTLGKTYFLEPIIEYWRNSLQRSAWQLLIIGDGDKFALYNTLACGCDNIFLTGFLDSALIPSILEQSNVGLASYVYGAPQEFPNKIFEYMSAGLPIISSLKGETPLLLKEQNIGFSYLDDKECIGVLKIITEMPIQALAASGQRAKAYFNQNFEQNIIYDAYSRYIETIAKNTY